MSDTKQISEIKFPVSTDYDDTILKDADGKHIADFDLYGSEDSPFTFNECQSNCRFIADAINARAQMESEIERLRKACEASQQCITDFIEVYKRDCSKLVFDEAVKSLRDDALKLVNKALEGKE